MVLRLRVVRPSVRLSVCNVGGSGSQRLPIARTISPTPSLSDQIVFIGLISVNIRLGVQRVNTYCKLQASVT